MDQPIDWLEEQANHEQSISSMATTKTEATRIEWQVSNTYHCMGTKIDLSMPLILVLMPLSVRVLQVNRHLDLLLQWLQ